MWVAKLSGGSGQGGWHVWKAAVAGSWGEQVVLSLPHIMRMKSFFIGPFVAIGRCFIRQRGKRHIIWA
jgi:hypothetical protein